MHKNQYQGKLIAFEGLDGSGTTTQSKLLSDWVSEKLKIPTFRTQEPTSGPIGALIRMVLGGRLTIHPLTLAALFAADRLDHLYSNGGVIEKLKSGSMVIMDRYYLSSWAYQTLRMENDEIEWLESLHEPCIQPDITFYLDVPVEICMDRITNKRKQQTEIYEKKNLLFKIEKQYKKAIVKFLSRGEKIFIIDGTLPIERINREVITYLEKLSFIN